MSLQERITQMARLRAQMARDSQALRELKAAFEGTPTVQGLRQRLAESQAEEAEIHDALAAEALEAFTSTGSKRPHPAVGIREERVLDYDPAQARDWSLANLPGALVLDTRTFSTVMRGLQGSARPPFVTETLTPKVTIKQDLGEYLEPE